MAWGRVQKGRRSGKMVRNTADWVTEPESTAAGGGCPGWGTAWMTLGSWEICSHTRDTTRALGPLRLVVGSTEGSKLGNSELFPLGA